MKAYYIGQDAIWADRPTDVKGIAHYAPGFDNPESPFFEQWTFTPATPAIGESEPKIYICHTSDLQQAELPIDDIERIYQWVAVDRYADRHPRLWEGDWCAERNDNPEMPALARGGSHLATVKAMLTKLI